MGTAEPVSRDEILKRERGQRNIIFPCSADHAQVWQPYSVDPCSCYVVDDVVVSHIQRIGCQPEKTILHGGQSRSWSTVQGKENKRKSLAANPPRHPPHCSFGENKQNHETHLQALRKSRSVSRPYKDTFGSSTRPMGVVSQNSTLPSAITSFPVSLLLSCPGDV